MKTSPTLASEDHENPPQGPLTREAHDRLSLSFYDNSLRATQAIAQGRGVDEQDYARVSLIENDPSVSLGEVPELEFAKTTLSGIWRNHREALMRLQDAGYHFTPQKNNPYFLFDAEDNWSAEGPEQVDQIDRNFKFHLMPHIADIPAVTQELLELLQSDKAFGHSVRSLKVLTRPRFDVRLGKNPSPEIVIYPYENVEAISTTLAGLEKYFRERPGRGIAPRFNVPVGDSSLLYIAEGHGHDKQMARAHTLEATYDASQNYAFRFEDQELVAQILQLASEKLQD